MQTTTFSNCCAARIISGFGGGHSWQAEEEHCSDRLTILEYVIKTIENLKEQGVVVVSAAPTSTQKRAVKALQELGFYHNDDGAFNRWSDLHRVYPMYFCTNELDQELFDSLKQEIAESKKDKKKANPFNKG